MSKDKKHISREDFQRYLENRMTGAERNAFERELQKHPFEADALEGLQQFSAHEIQNDLNGLSEKISPKSKKRNTRFWAAAATLLLLVSVGVIWFRIKDKSPIPEMAETKSAQKQEGKVVPPGQPEENSFSEIQPEGIKEENRKITEQEKKIPKAKKEIRNSGPIKEKASEKTADVSNETIQAKPSENLSEHKIIQISNQEGTATADVEIKTKEAPKDTQIRIRGASFIRNSGTNDSALMTRFVRMEETGFYSAGDSTIVPGPVPSQVPPDDVVAIGYGVSSDGHDFKTIQSARPVAGMKDFKKYLKENAVLSEKYHEKRAVVKVKFTIDSQGKIISLENKNDAEPGLFERAKELILNGPEWNPKTIDKTPSESEITLRIVFRKKE
jgi:hypothetical protein